MLRLNPFTIRPTAQLVWPRLRATRITGRFQGFKRFQRLQSTTTTQQPPKKPTGIKALIKEYGYLALGIYFALTALDLPICYVIVHSAGKETIEEYENKAKNIFGYGISEEELKAKQQLRHQQELQDAANDPNGAANDSASSYLSWEYIKSQFSWTEFAIAYGLHKSLIVIRLPITAAITPSVVGILRGWGFKIGKASITAAAALAVAQGAKKVADATALNPKFGTAPGKRKWWWFF